jgi:hypothetical protein
VVHQAIQMRVRLPNGVNGSKTPSNTGHGKKDDDGRLSDTETAEGEDGDGSENEDEDDDDNYMCAIIRDKQLIIA